MSLSMTTGSSCELKVWLCGSGELKRTILEDGGSFSILSVNGGGKCGRF